MPALGAGGREFESRYPDKKINDSQTKESVNHCFFGVLFFRGSIAGRPRVDRRSVDRFLCINFLVFVSVYGIAHEQSALLNDFFRAVEVESGVGVLRHSSEYVGGHKL